VAIFPAVEQGEPWRQVHRLAHRFLDDHDRLRHEPAARAQTGKRRCRQPSAVGRIEKGEPEGGQRRASAKPGRITAPDLRLSDHAESVGIAPDRAAGLLVVIDEQHVTGTARQRLEPERAAAGEEIEDADARQRQSLYAMFELVEDRLANPVGGRAGVAAARRCEGPAAEAAADDPHAPQPLRGSLPPSCSRSTRGLISSTAPRGSSPSMNGPKEMRMSRLTLSPRCSHSLLISRFLPSLRPKSSQALSPWTRSRPASIAP